MPRATKRRAVRRTKKSAAAVDEEDDAREQPQPVAGDGAAADPAPRAWTDVVADALAGRTGAVAEDEAAALMELEALSAGKTPPLRRQMEEGAATQAARAWAQLRDRVRSLPSSAPGKDDARLLAIAADLGMQWLQLLQEERASAQKQQKQQQAALRQAPAALLECLRALHDRLFSLGSAKEAARKICRCCETWWLLELRDRELLVTHSLPLLLVFSLDDGARKADVKRVASLRGMLLVIDLEDDSSVTLRQLLLRCFLSPLYLCSDEGVRFLGDLCVLSEEFVADIHATIKAQLPYAAEAGEETMLLRYAEVYFRAWRTAAAQAEEASSSSTGNGRSSTGSSSSSAILERVEKDMLQDLMDNAVHVADSALSLALLKLLNAALHDRKHIKEVDAMLLRLYNPILWRALEAVHPLVRRNAARLLARAFPLQDPAGSVADGDALLQRQFGAVESLLRDACPQVRVAGVQAACRLLSVYWELIPRQATAALVAALAGDLLHDASSAEVRVAVLRGLEFVSENPLSHGALREVLPHASPLIHDQSRAVRNALVSLLLRVKAIRAIKFYELVPADHLLERLAIDAQLASKLTKLLLESYFPQGVSGSEQLRRIVAMIDAHPAAALRFMEQLRRHLPTGPVCKLAILLGKWVANEVVAKRASGKDERLERSLRAAMHGVAALWASVAPQLRSPRYQTARRQLQETFSLEAFVRPVLAAREGEGKLDLPPLMEIAAMLPVDEAFQHDVLREVRAYQPARGLRDLQEAPPQTLDVEVKSMAAVIGPAVQCLCLWQAEDALLADIEAALQASCSSANDGKKKAAKKKTTAKAKQTKRGKGRGKSKEDEEEGESGTMDPLVALWCLQDVLANNPNDARERLLNEQVERLASVATLLDELLQVPLALETAMKLAIHAALQARRARGPLLDEEEEAKQPSQRRRRGGEFSNEDGEGEGEETGGTRMLPRLHRLAEWCAEDKAAGEQHANILLFGASESVALGLTSPNDPELKRVCARLVERAPEPLRAKHRAKLAAAS